MTEFHELDENGETAADFLRSLSAKPFALAEEKPPERPRRGKRPARSAAPAAASMHAATAGVGTQPWVAASASLLVWGAGQWMNGQRSLAVLFLTLEALAAAMFYCLATTWESWLWLADIFFVPVQTIRIAVFAVGAAAPLFAIACVMQAYYRAARNPRARVFFGPPPIPAIASGAIPGWGQILNDQVGKATVFLTVATLSAYTVWVSLQWPEFWAILDATANPLAGVRLSVVTLGAVVLGGLAWVVSVYDAFLTARQRNATADAY